MKKVSIDNAASEIIKELKEYGEEVSDEIKIACKEVAKQAVSDIKIKSPQKTGEYKKGWKQKTVFENAKDIRIQIYNSKKPQLTHLLEKGHAKVNGGRVYGTPHIEPAEQKAIKSLEGKVKVIAK